MDHIPMSAGQCWRYDNHTFLYTETWRLPTQHVQTNGSGTREWPDISEGTLVILAMGWSLCDSYNRWHVYLWVLHPLACLLMGMTHPVDSANDVDRVTYGYDTSPVGSNMIDKSCVWVQYHSQQSH